MVFAFYQIYSSLFIDITIWWVLAPVFILWIIMEIYLGEYKNETVGWNTALANGISLSWINISSMRALFNTVSISFNFRLIFLLFVFFYGLFLFYISFTHHLTKEWAVRLAGPTLIYFLSIVSVLWGYDLLPVNFWVIFDLIIIFLVVFFMFYFISKYLLGFRGDVEAVKHGEYPV